MSPLLKIIYEIIIPHKNLATCLKKKPSDPTSHYIHVSVLVSAYKKLYLYMYIVYLQHKQ